MVSRTSIYLHVVKWLVLVRFWVVTSLQPRTSRFQSEDDSTTKSLSWKWVRISFYHCTWLGSMFAYFVFIVNKFTKLKVKSFVWSLGFPVLACLSLIFRLHVKSSNSVRKTNQEEVGFLIARLIFMLVLSYLNLAHFCKCDCPPGKGILIILKVNSNGNRFTLQKRRKLYEMEKNVHSLNLPLNQ